MQTSGSNVTMISSASYCCRFFMLESCFPGWSPQSSPGWWRRRGRRRRHPLLLLPGAVDRDQPTNNEEDTEGIEEDRDHAEVAAEHGVAPHETDRDEDSAPEDALHGRVSWFEELPM